MIAFMRELRARGLRLAICTNNVREWEHRWRAMVPVPEVFDVVVDSAHVGMRKPEPGIYELTLERLGVAAGDALFVDDVEINCDAAQALGLRTVWFRSTEQAIDDIEAALARAGLTVRRWLGAGAVLAAAIVVLIIAAAGAGTPDRGRAPRAATATVTARARRRSCGAGHGPTVRIHAGRASGAPVRPGFLGFSFEFQAVRATRAAIRRRSTRCSSS